MYDGEEYLFTPDPPHMLKLGRNALSDYQAFISGNGEKIEWRFIESLHLEQEKEGLKFANKLSSKHIFYHRYTYFYFGCALCVCVCVRYLI